MLVVYFSGILFSLKFARNRIYTVSAVQGLIAEYAFCFTPKYVYVTHKKSYD